MPTASCRLPSNWRSSQNHGFCVDIDSMADADVELTHVNLNDRTLEGFRHRRLPVFAVQYHPEASPGPHDAGRLFGEFVAMMEEQTVATATPAPGHPERSVSEAKDLPKE